MGNPGFVGVASLLLGPRPRLIDTLCFYGSDYVSDYGLSENGNSLHHSIHTC